MSMSIRLQYTKINQKNLMDCLDSATFPTSNDGCRQIEDEPQKSGILNQRENPK
jgi:hypothetical protein